MHQLNQRNFRLDVIRFVGMVFVFAYHFDVENKVYGLKHFITHTEYHSINLGGIGVMLFFLLSGEVHRKYRKKQEEGFKFKIISYYRRRLISIYPLFYIAYSIALLMLFLLKDDVFISFRTIEKWKFLLTLLAADGYFPQMGSTFYLVGEWFTTVIIMIYILFPVIRICIADFKTYYFIILSVLVSLGVLELWRPMGIVFDGNIFLAIMVFSIGYCTEGILLKAHKAVVIGAGG